MLRIRPILPRVRGAFGTALLVAFAAAAPASSSDASAGGDERSTANQARPTAKERRADLERWADELRHETVHARIDLEGSGPPPRSGRLTELSDGSYYEHADARVLFEELAPTRVARARLRKGGRVLLLHLEPPSDVRPHGLRGPGINVGDHLILELDAEEAGGVEEALRSVLYLPGDSPDEETIERCLSRYPEHDERTSRLRCGLGAR